MVRCVNCRNLDRQNRVCNALNVTIKLADIHKELPCKKYLAKEVIE